MHQLEVPLKNNKYTILIKQELSNRFDSMLENIEHYSKIFIVTQQSIIDSVSCNALSKYPTIVIPEGEDSKSISAVESVVSQLMDLGCNRDSLLVGFGGGTVTDFTGFVASIFMRGIDHVFIPTTLLGMVDSSIGGKTGVNNNGARNVIGTFKQPKAIYIDPLFLKTLSKKDIISGFAEIIKYGLIADKKFYNTVKSNFIKLIRLENIDQIESIIYQCCKHKINFFIDDEFDYNKRMILNFGHTIGHAIESYYNYKNISHGEAVYYGMIASAFISHKHGLLIESDFNHIHDFIFNISKVGLNNLDSEKVYKYIKYDKKRMGNKNYFILLNDIGKADIVENVTSDDIKEAITFIANYEYSCN